MSNEKPIITIIYNKVKHWHADGEDAFFYWLKKIKSVKGCKGFHPSILEVYIDSATIDYMQLLSLWSLFKIYRVKGREQLEQLLPYLPKKKANKFQKRILNPWQNRKLKNKKNLK